MKWYVGLKDNKRTAFKSEKEPTQSTHGEFDAAVGPFNTKRAAVWFTKNYYCHDVRTAEKLAKLAKDDPM